MESIASGQLQPGLPWLPSRLRLTPLDLLLAAALFLLLAWLLIAAPLSKLRGPIEQQSITLLSAQGLPIARRGAIIADPVEVDHLPDLVYQAFLAIEDRRFFDHIGIDAVGIGRAALRNLGSGAAREGGSTITQQLAKMTYLSSDRSLGRKLREMVIAIWMEGALSKDEILGRYLSTAYFGDNVYGLRAAARHYFDTEPEKLSVPQAAMLAGLVKAPSRLNPTSHLEAARARTKLVIGAMAEAGVLSTAEAEAMAPPRLKLSAAKPVPSGTYFADWAFKEMESAGDELHGVHEIYTNLDSRLQRLAIRAVRNARLGEAQAALIAMRPDGRVVAMVGGKSYSNSPFNRATQARRQPGSTFKLFVYLAALESGITPEALVRDEPIRLGDWAPQNADGIYRGPMPLRDAFAVSSNVATVRIAEAVGRDKVIDVARRLGIRSSLQDRPSLALGTSEMTLLEMTQAFAGVAGNRFPVEAHALRREDSSWFSRIGSGKSQLDERTTLPMMLDLLWSSANVGTGRAAALRTPTFGKTGTSQDNRDALFIGFAKDLVTAVWVGRDDNAPMPGVSGGGVPALIGRDFMADALNVAPAGRYMPIAAVPAAPRAARPPAARDEPRAIGKKSRGKGKGKKKGKRKKK